LEKKQKKNANGKNLEKKNWRNGGISAEGGPKFFALLFPLFFSRFFFFFFFCKIKRKKTPAMLPSLTQVLGASLNSPPPQSNHPTEVGAKKITHQ
jgi:hypothetical protein